MPSLNLRLADELHAALVAAAAASGRSLQREIVMRLDGRVVGGLGSGEVLAAGSPPVTVAPVSPEPSPLAAGDTANTGGRATRPPMSASGSSEGEVSDAVTPAASGPKAFRPDPKKKP